MIYNPLDKFYKSIIGAVPAQKEITFRVKGDFGSVVFVLRKDGCDESMRYNMDQVGEYFELKICIDVGLYFYYFDLSNGNYVVNDNFVGVIKSKIAEFQLTAYADEFCVPSWIYGGVIYQIFPDRFYRANKDKKIRADKILHKNWNENPVYLPNDKGKIINNDFFGGDLNGIAEKLDYFAALGVTVLYLNPIFEAFSNHRYDTGDYMKIDSLLGDENDFINLISKANEKGINIILDGVFNHTGDDSRYFNKHGNYDCVGAYQDKNSKYYDWYNFTQYPDKYEAWWGIETLPSINESNESFIDFITGENGVLSHYTKLGACGWRLDVVDELPSSFVKKIRARVKAENPQAVIIGEVWEDVSNKISYGIRREYFQGAELDSAMNYPLKNAIIDFVKFGNEKILSKVVKEQIDHYPHSALHAMMNILSTHDTMRLLTVLAGQEPFYMTKEQMANYIIPEEKMPQAIFMLKVASLLQFTLCGVPSIYYGDEIGMQGYGDPLNRHTFNWESQNEDIKSWYKFLCQLRRDYSAFSIGQFEEVYSANGAYCFIRKCDDSELFIGINLSRKDILVNYDCELFDLINQKDYINECVLEPNSLCILVKK